MQPDDRAAAKKRLTERRTHGLNSTYAVGCRCDACREAHRAWMLDYYHRRGIHRPAEIVNAERRTAADAMDNHGTEHRYKRGCRCRACRDASADARRRRRAARAIAL